MSSAPTPAQLRDLKSLASRTGTTFAYPTTRTQAHAQIQRLENQQATGRSFAERERTTPEVYGTGRFSESTGYGGRASCGRDRVRVFGEQSDPPVVTDRQEAAIIEHQHLTGDTTVSATVSDSTVYLYGAQLFCPVLRLP